MIHDAGGAIRSEIMLGIRHGWTPHSSDYAARSVPMEFHINTAWLSLLTDRYHGSYIGRDTFSYIEVGEGYGVVVSRDSSPTPSGGYDFQ